MASMVLDSGLSVSVCQIHPFESLVSGSEDTREVRVGRREGEEDGEGVSQGWRRVCPVPP